MEGLYTVSRLHRCTITIKKSRFITTVAPVDSASQAQDQVSRVKREFADANHNVFAYVIGENNTIQKFSDDGEPSGTAGVPVLEAIKKSGVTNTVLIVTRYFGGIMLGTGGLVRAYTQAAKAGIDEAGITRMCPHVLTGLTIDYNLLELVRNMIERVHGYVDNSDYGEKVVLSTFIPSEQLEVFKNELSCLPGVGISIGITRLLPERDSVPSKRD